MSEFVDECRREWRRLGVPEPIANEMAADLTADLDEAEAEGSSPEDVLGNSAFDPRRFAAAWASARGVTGPPATPAPARPSAWRPSWGVVVAVLAGVLVVGAGMVLAVGARSSAISVATARVGGPGPRWLFGPGPGRSLGSRFVLPLVGVGVHPLAWILFVAVAGLAVLAALGWALWSLTRRTRRHEGPRTPSLY